MMDSDRNLLDVIRTRSVETRRSEATARVATMGMIGFKVVFGRFFTVSTRFSRRYPKGRHVKTYRSSRITDLAIQRKVSV